MRLIGFIFFALIVNSIFATSENYFLEKSSFLPGTCNCTNTHSINYSGGSDYISISENFTFSDLQGVTFSVWVKKPSLNSGCCANGYIVDFSDGTCDNCWAYRYSLTQQDNNFIFAKEGSSLNGWTLTTSAIGFDNKWVHLVGVANAQLDSVYIYINGELKSSGKFAGIAALNLSTGNSTSKVLGERSVSLNRGFDGLSDDLSIWNYAMNPNQVQSLYKSCLEGTEAGLLGYWNFDEGSGTDIDDKTANNNNGTIINSALFSTDKPDIFFDENNNGVCDLMDITDVTDAYNLTDPCSCSDTQNRTVKGIYLFHDILTVLGTAGQTVQVIAPNDGMFLDSNGDAITLPITMVETAPGIYQTDFWHRTGETTTISTSMNGGPATTFVSSLCDATVCPPSIPSLSQWSLKALCLLMMIIGVVTIRAKVKVF